MGKKLTTNEFIRRSKSIHGDKYDYSKTVYINSRKKICLICHKRDNNGIEHGEFWQTSQVNINEKCGCPKCARQNRRLTKEQFIEKANKRHNDKYDYTKLNFINVRNRVRIICPEHGEFWQVAQQHLEGCGCPKCAINNRRNDINELIKKSVILHNSKYDYSLVNYNKTNEKVEIICPIHGIFKQRMHDHLRGCGCPKCANKQSIGECQIFNFLNAFIKNVEDRNRTVIPPYELDIYIPSKQIAIEYNGLIWHSERFCEDAPKAMLHKSQLCAEKGIRLIHIFEDEWLEKPQIVKSTLRNILGVTSDRVYARQCDVRDVDSRTAMQFLDDNHIQGRCKAKYHYGLYYKDELVSLMTFGKTRQQRKYNEDYDNTWELLRFCNKLNTTVVGGASKLLKTFIREVKPHRIVTYADKRWSVGNLYERLGFTHTHDSKPNYFYVVGEHRENRFKYRKGELVKHGFDKDKSEHEIMLERGIPRIYDCGTMAFEMTIE